MDSELVYQKFIDHIKWITGLAPLDLANFLTLVSLPTIDDLIERMPLGAYKDNMIIAHKLIQVFSQLQHLEEQ